MCAVSRYFAQPSAKLGLLIATHDAALEKAFVTLDMAEPTAAERFYTAVFGLGTLARERGGVSRRGA